MGVLNLTPDSFFAPSRVDEENVRRRAETMLADGAHILDIGGESTRPGSSPAGLEGELGRVLPALEALAGLDAAISLDTYRAETAHRGIALGVSMINDITALRGDPELAGVVAASGVECVLMHMQGTPETMQRAPQYEDVVDDINAFFEERLAFATKEGIAAERIWLDPGFGFGKTVEHNLTLLRRLDEFGRFGRPILVGTSNKSTIGAVLDTGPEDRDEGTAATVCVSILKGARCVRVHNVKAMARVAKMCDAILGRETR